MPGTSPAARASPAVTPAAAPPGPGPPPGAGARPGGAPAPPPPRGPGAAPRRLRAARGAGFARRVRRGLLRLAAPGADQAALVAREPRPPQRLDRRQRPA